MFKSSYCPSPILMGILAILLPLQNALAVELHSTSQVIHGAEFLSKVLEQNENLRLHARHFTDPKRNGISVPYADQCNLSIFQFTHNKEIRISLESRAAGWREMVPLDSDSSIEWISGYGKVGSRSVYSGGESFWAALLRGPQKRVSNYQGQAPIYGNYQIFVFESHTQIYLKNEGSYIAILTPESAGQPLICNL